ncbi:MAG TPA: hypothetical protein VF597_01910 [Candidatus Saccharimonadales bacterium]|jgi:glycogen debranching enzyme
MDIVRYRTQLDDVIPGALAAYESLRATNGMGIYTSNGSFYNHTFFGRDASMSAKFATDFDHLLARETILALAALQGTNSDAVTQEERGRIHHEYRDFGTWKASWYETIALKFFARNWGLADKTLLTYYAGDTTALYVRLVHKYWRHIDKSVLDTTVTNADEQTYPVRESVALAADWIMAQINQTDHFVTARPNDWALPYQTFADSSTAFVRQNGRLANYRRGITYTETQALAIDALEAATHLLEDHPHRHEWQVAAHSARSALIKDFWNEQENFFGSAYDKDGLVDMPTISAGWTLNTSFWDELSERVRSERISAIVTRLFSDDFLTPFGLRSRSLTAPAPLKGLVEYHGRLTVWPMFTFMVIEGLRRQRLHTLAEELENRLINGINASDRFDEFFVIDTDGNWLHPADDEPAKRRMDAQMAPEQNIAFTVVPAVTLAWRSLNPGRALPVQNEWQKQLEIVIMTKLTPTARLTPLAAKAAVDSVPTEFRRVRGNIRTAWFFWRQRRRM